MSLSACEEMAAIDLGIAAEKANALGRAGQSAEVALARLAAAQSQGATMLKPLVNAAPMLSSQ